MKIYPAVEAPWPQGSVGTARSSVFLGLEEVIEAVWRLLHHMSFGPLPGLRAKGANPRQAVI